MQDSIVWPNNGPLRALLSDQQKPPVYRETDRTGAGVPIWLMLREFHQILDLFDI